MFDLAQMVLYHRKKARLSRNDFATLCGVGKTVIFDLEKGKRTIQLDTLMKILTALNIKITYTSPLMKQFLEEQNENH